MIRARMSFGGFSELRRVDAEGKNVLIDPSRDWWQPEEVKASLEDGTFRTVKTYWHPVSTSDPKSPNAKWAAASPSGNLTIWIANPHAVRDILEMCEKAKTDGRKNQGKYETCEFYVDIYPAPAED